jgi:hypothetical protein
MESIDLGYSMKNIPIHPINKYMKTLIAKTEHFLKRMRWKAFFAESDEEKDEVKETFGFKTEKTPPQHELLNDFEEDIYDLIRSVEFSNAKSTFQQKLDKDISKLRDSGNVVVPADKTTNIYTYCPQKSMKNCSRKM